MTGYMFTLTGGAIGLKISKPIIIASLVMYNDISTCYEAMGQSIWLKKFVPPFKNGRQYIKTFEAILQ
jgi:hypothetical protein